MLVSLNLLGQSSLFSMYEKCPLVLNTSTRNRSFTKKDGIAGAVKISFFIILISIASLLDKYTQLLEQVLQEAQNDNGGNDTPSVSKKRSNWKSQITNEGGISSVSEPATGNTESQDQRGSVQTGSENTSISEEISSTVQVASSKPAHGAKAINCR